MITIANHSINARALLLPEYGKLGLKIANCQAIKFRRSYSKHLIKMLSFDEMLACLGYYDKTSLLATRKLTKQAWRKMYSRYRNYISNSKEVTYLNFQ